MKDIILKDNISPNEMESYIMLSGDAVPENEKRDKDQTIIVKRMNLIFNEQEC